MQIQQRLIYHHLHKEIKPSFLPGFNHLTQQGRGCPLAPAGTCCPCPCVCPHLTHGQCWSHTDSQGCTMQPNLHSVRLVVDLWRGQTLSLVSGAPLPTLGMGKGQLWHPQASSLPCPSQGTEPFLAPLILWTFSCGWKRVGGAGGSSVASQGVLEVLYWMLLIAGWALGQ